MNARVYANRTSLELTSRLDGSPFTPPTVAQGQTINLYLRLSEDVDDTSVVDSSTIDAATVRFGKKDAAPEQGTYDLTISLSGTDAEVAGLAYNATATAVQTAINTALDGVIASLHPCTVTDYEGHYRIVFEDNTLAPTITCTDNALWPMSFVDVDQISWDEGNAWLLQLRQTPVAETSVISEVVPSAPTITRVQGGTTNDGIAVNEIQKLTIPPNFSGGSFQIVRGGIKTDPIPVPVQSGTTTIPAKLVPLADAGGSFALTAVRDGFYIEFQGTMGGEAQDLMTITTFEAAPSEWLVQINTDTDEFRTLMLGADTDGEIEVPFNLTLEIEDTLDANVSVPVIWESDWTFKKRIADDTHNVSAGLVWNQPRSRTDNLPHSTDSLLVGNRAVVKTIGDGAATSFTINHNLLENAVTVTADAGTDAFTAADHGFQNGDPVTVAATTSVPGGLTEGTTYYVRGATTNTFQVATAAGGSAIDLTSAGSGTITVALADGTAADAVFVQVWETGGTKAMVSPEDYTVTRPSNNAVTVSGFASTPTSGQYQVIVQTAGRPATYQGHTHTIAEITSLQATLDALSARVTALEALAPAGVPFSGTSITSGGEITRTLRPYWNVVRSRRLPEAPISLLGWNPYTLDSPLRPSRLLPAVHDASLETLPTPLPAPSAIYAGRVFNVGTAVGNFRVGDKVACDGREWYRVSLETAGTETTYYPVDFNLELFRLGINEKQFISRSVADLVIGFELALYPATRRVRDTRTAATWSFILEYGVRTSDSTPATTGTNLDEFFTSPVIIVEQRLDVAEQPGQHRFGLSAARDGDGDIVMTPIIYGAETAVVTPPSSANFAVRARLARFDTENDPTDARGLIAIRGLDVALDGTADPNLGKLVIS